MKKHQGLMPNIKKFTFWFLKLLNKGLTKNQCVIRSKIHINASPIFALSSGLLKRDIIYWIGLNDRNVENVYVWNDETTPVIFHTWRKPVIYNFKYMY